MFALVGLTFSKEVTLYLMTFLFIQILLLLACLELRRKPWEGKEAEVERAANQ